ncbi:hypothetical protein BDN72DRAFT_964642 [Pluteus cervinus]|uniref:Uncharacterized protein n=1 Tax=Pluteus cervinus TaxID=181527 RepID=A0ACD3A9L2_9AGAR|nr:hypothetical protein BDN72DRAFT_964642 [Pluteus cervinus]
MNPWQEISTLNATEDEQFAQNVQSLLGSSSTESLVTQARFLVAKLAESEDSDTYNILGVASIRLHTILSGLLDRAPECNGSEALRYSSTLVVACTVAENLDQTLQLLHELAIAWITNFLYFFAVPLPKREYLKEVSLYDPSPLQDLALERLFRAKPLVDSIMERDGYQFLVTGRKDHNHPDVQRYGTRSSRLTAGHILPRAFSYIYTPHLLAFNSATSTANILRRYCGLSEDFIINMRSQIDDPENSFTVHMWGDTCYHNWTLFPTEMKNQYRLKTFNGGHEINLSDEEIKTRIVEFTDYSAKGIPLPNPHFFRIRAAIWALLHKSGGADFFDDLLGSHEGWNFLDIPIFEFQDLLKAVRARVMREEFYQVHDLESCYRPRLSRPPPKLRHIPVE